MIYFRAMLKKTNFSKEELISVVVPVLNESGNLSILYERVTKSLRHFKYEIIFINDGSNDDTIEAIKSLASKDSSVRLINLSRNFGHQLAVSCGLDFADGDAVVIMDADLQDPPELIVKMIKKWKEGYDVVYAVRKERMGETFLKKVTAKIFYRALKKVKSVEELLTSPKYRNDLAARLFGRLHMRNRRHTRQQVSNAKDQFLWLKRLEQKIVRARFKTLDAIGGISMRGEHDNREQAGAGSLANQLIEALLQRFPLIVVQPIQLVREFLRSL